MCTLLSLSVCLFWVYFFSQLLFFSGCFDNTRPEGAIQDKASQCPKTHHSDPTAPPWTAAGGISENEARGQWWRTVCWCLYSKKRGRSHGILEKGPFFIDAVWQNIPDFADFVNNVVFDCRTFGHWRTVWRRPSLSARRLRTSWLTIRSSKVTFRLACHTQCLPKRGVSYSPSLAGLIAGVLSFSKYFKIIPQKCKLIN